MSVATELDAFEALAKALGILKPSGSPNDAWFADPVGQSSNLHGIQDILSDDDQRNALLSFADDVLGAPDRDTRDGATWLPLFHEVNPKVTIYAVVKPVGTAVHIGVGFEHAMTPPPGVNTPIVATRIHVPLFRVARGTASLALDGGVEPWLLIGRPGATVDVALDLTLRTTPPPAGDASLGGLSVALGIPTDGSANVRFAMELRELQLPGGTAPRTIVLDAATPGAIGAEVLELLATLVRSQVDALAAANPLPAEVAGLLGLLGLRSVNNLPALPLADLPTRGLNALVEWLRGVFTATASRTAWFGQLRQIIGGAIDAGAESVSTTTGALTFTVGVRATTGAGGALVVIPWIALSLTPSAGAKVRLLVELLRADLSTGAVTAIPDLRAEALFGTEAGGPPLLTGGTSVAGLRTGLVLRADRRPAFALTLHDVRVAGRDYPMLDISSPQAAVTAVDSVVSGALEAAIAEFGAASNMVGRMLGIRPPAGVTGVSAAELLRDPLAEVTRYWRDLASTAPAMSEVLGALQSLIGDVAVPTVPGNGSKAVPWRIALRLPLVVLIWRDAGALVVDLAVDVETPVLDGMVATTTLRGSLLRLQFDPIAVTFVGAARAVLELKNVDLTPLKLELGTLELSAQSIRGVANWSASAGLQMEIEAPESLATITLPNAVTAFPLPLPIRGPDGRFTVPPELWPDAQALIVALAGRVQMPVVDEFFKLLGWTGDVGAELSLATLVAGDAEMAIREWLADQALECDRVRQVMGIVARLFSGGQVDAALGSGSVRSPYFAPIAGDSRAPGVVSWLVPPCPPRTDFGKALPALRAPDTPEDGASMAVRLTLASEQLPDLRDLLTNRDSLGIGFEQLVSRWIDTDGVIVTPLSIPAGVTLLRQDGMSYDDMVADGASGLLVSQLFSAEPATVVHVGCEEVWRTDRPAGRAVDAVGGTVTGSISAAGTGEWFVALPTAIAARAMRTDRDGVAEQADRLRRVLAARTAPITIVAYGACAAAALRVALNNSLIAEVATVGAPWTAPSVNAFRSGFSADALRVLERLLRDGQASQPPLQRAIAGTPLDVMRDVITRAFAVASDDETLPNAGAEARRAGLRCSAMFGALDEDSLRRGMGAVLDAGIDARFATAREVSNATAPRTALHVGVQIPVLAADIAGIRVGIGATLNLATLERDTARAFKITTARAVTINIELGVVDGWLVGGPSPEAGDVDLRRMSAHVTIPFDGSAGDTEFVLYEASGLGAFRERWVVRADADGISATRALPEVRAVVSAVIARLRIASPALGQLLDVAGLIRDGGLDAAGLDRLLFEPQLVAAQVRARALEVAASLRTLVSGMVGAASQLEWTVGNATLALDLASRTASVTATTTVANRAPCTVSATLTADGLATAECAIGALDPLAGGVRVVARAGATNTVAVEWRGSGASPTRTMALLPTPDVAAFTGFASTLVPSYLAHGIVASLRNKANATARAALDAALDAAALLHSADTAGRRAVRLPIALFDDASGWFLQGAESWRSDPAGSAVRALDSLAPILAPARGPAAGWPIANGISVRYVALSGRLELSIDAALNSVVGTAAVVTRVIAGVRIANDGRVEPLLETSVTVDGRGLQLSVTPTVQLSLVRLAPAPLLAIYPAGAGLGGILTAVGDTVLPPVLNALSVKRNDAGATLIKRVGQAIFDLGGALDLRDATNFTAAQISAFAADPAARLMARLPNLVSSGTAALVQAIDQAGTLVRVVVPGAGQVKLEFGSARQISLTLDTSGPTPAVLFGGTLAVPAIGNIVVERLRLATDGVGISARVGPAPLAIGGVTLRPMLSVRAGVLPAGVSPLAAFGLALDPAGAKAVELRWSLNNSAPVLAVVTRGPGEAVDLDPARAALSLIGVAASMASGIAFPHVLPLLPPTAITGLQKVLLVTVGANTTLDPSFFDDLLQPERLFTRLKRLAWNLATDAAPPSVTIGGKVTIALAHKDDGAAKQLGLTLDLVGDFEIASGNPIVSLVTDASWITGSPVAPGLSIFVLRGNVVGDDVQLALSPGFTVGGIGLRFSKTAGPLLELGPISLDGIAVHLFAEMSQAGVGGGAQLELSGLAIAPASAGGNPVASGILADAARGGSSNRPAFSPGIAVQSRIGDTGVGVSVRAGPPPGPWWLVVQRELGPLYLERLGFDSRTSAGTITRLQLLFDGRVSLFGMTAAVDQLSLTWNGGDVFDASRWAADLNGLAISADMAGVSIAGGLLKDSSGGYLGMLLGRFGTYGLTLYGGYAVLDGNPSFFIFGALNGPIGGPPAFFLTGIGAGLGINRQLRVPDDLSQFGEYPFIKALDIAASVSNPMDELRKLNDYFKPQAGQFWVAAGISFTSFALVDGIAVVAVAFGSDGLDINLLGLARMALPRPEVAIVSIELGLLARFSTREGLFSIRAQLTENSWLLYPEVRLTGGFAFVVWWKGPLSGQFVLTIGGYHPRFHRDGYPDVPRVGLTWQVSDAIVIKGGAYFALTSEALMAGLEVVVSADFGWAWARIEFGANGIVYFDPFWFEVEAYATISAGVKIKTWLGTIRFSLSTGASLMVQGPDFGGRASFHVGPAKITVPFGSDTKRRGTEIDWPSFVTKYLEDGAGGGARALSAITGLGTLPRKASAAQAESADGSSARPFEVFGEFQLAITSSVPIKNLLLVGLPPSDSVHEPTRPDGAGISLGLSPMVRSNMRSTLTLTLVGASSEPGVPGDHSVVLSQSSTRREFDREAFPIGVWGAPGSENVKAIPTGDVIFALNRIRFDLRSNVNAPTIPAITYRKVVFGRASLPLRANGGLRADMFSKAVTVEIPTPSTTAASMIEASSRLFAARTTDVPNGMLSRGTLGASSAAAFRGDRVAPPLFGNLADGLQRTNAADVAGAVVPVGPPGVKVQPRPPRLVGVLAGGAGVIERGASTSVADGRLKRRPAPSIDSVRARLTRQLPVQLARTARPGVSEQGTIIAAGVVPFTAAPGTARSFAAGRTVSGGALGSVVGGLERNPLRRARRGAPGAVSGLHAGDLAVLTAPDASIDLDTQARPSLTVNGQARVTMTASDGMVLVDATVTDRIAIPPRTAVIGVHAGGTTSVLDGMAGWHERTRLARFSALVAIGPGCALQVRGVVRQATSGWLGASALVAEATSVNTRFTVPVRTVIVVLAGADTPSFDEVIVELDGAKRVADKAGVERAPRVVMSGSRATLIYDVVPTRGMTVAVSVQTGGQWRLAGVLGGMLDSTTVAQTIAVRGVAAVVGRLLVAADGAPVVVDWNPPPDRVGARVAKQSATRGSVKKSAAKRAAARGSTAVTATKKSGVNKSATKTSPRKTSPRKKSPRKTSAGKTSAGKTAAGKTAAVNKLTTRPTAKKRVSKESPARRTTARTTTSTTRRGGK